MDDEIRFIDILEVLTRHQVEFVIVGGVAAIKLEAIIEAKVFADRDKDRAVLPVLRRTLELKRSK